MGLLSKIAEMLSNDPKIRIEGAGHFDFEVVGESNYQGPLKRICGGRKKEPARHLVEAILVHEDDNEHDKKAIEVEIEGHTVAYLSRDDARNYRRRLKKAGHPGESAYCDAVIVGGWNRGFFDKGKFGVKLDIPDEGKLEVTVPKPRA